MTAELQKRVDDALRRSGRRPGLLVVGATDGGDTAFASRGPLPEPPCAPERAVFEIGSITKVFTALLLALAAERGELGLDDPLVEHLPRGTRVPMRDGRPITLVDLATPPVGASRAAARVPPARAPPPRRPLCPPLDGGRPRSARGYASASRRRERFRYSNYGAGVLGIALAHAAATDYEALVRERITTPLGLRDTVIAMSEDHRSRLAPGTKRWAVRPVSGRSPV